MRCPKCNNANAPGLKYCNQCGEPLRLVCPACGFENVPGSRFCGECRHLLAQNTGDAATANSATQSTALGIPGERRQATVLFSDLSGYTAMNERLDPEEVRGIVGRIKAEAVRVVEGHGGIVNQFVGDEVMALFGIPLSHEDDPVRAVRAARDLHAIVRATSPEVEKRIGAALRLHTGIGTGLVVTGTEDRRDGTIGVTGDAVNLSARLASHAASDMILVSEEAQRAIADFFQTEPLPAVELKGKSGRVTPHRIVDQTGVSSRFEAAAQRGFTAYAGRELELHTLYTALEETRAERGQFVTIMGEPGIGKSRLLFEFRHGVPRDQVTVVTGYCQSYGVDTPYLPIVDSLRRGLRLDEAHGADALHDHVVLEVRAVSSALERYLPQYLQLLSIPSEVYKIPPALQADALRRSFEEAFAAIITENARRQPMVLILEDWHWADEASDAVLKHLSGLVPYHPLQVVVTYRPEYERKWATAENYTPLVLKPLGEADTAAMLRSVWRAQRLPDGLAAQLHARTGGNALFNEEVARALLETNVVRIANGEAKLSSALAHLNLPDTVHAVIRARVDQLDPESREVLRLASVIGREFTRPLLERLHHAPQRISAALEMLARQDLVHPLRVVPEPAYLFKHALVQDVVYETLLLSQRKELHARVGAAIEALYSDRLEEHYEALAGHYGKSALTEKAIDYLEKAADKANSVFSHGEARSYYRRAIELLDSKHGDHDAKRKRIGINLKWAALSVGDTSPAALEVMKTSMRLAHEIGDMQLQARTTCFAGYISWILGSFQDATRYFGQVIDMTGQVEDEESIAIAHGVLGRDQIYNRKLIQGIQSLETADSIFRRSALTYEGLAVHLNLGLGYALSGEFERGRDILEAGRGSGPTQGITSLEHWFLNWIALAWMYQGEWGSAVAKFDAAIAVASDAGDLLPGLWGRVFKGYALAVSGQLGTTDSLPSTQASIDKIEGAGIMVLISWHYSLLAQIYLLNGNDKKAAEYAMKANNRIPHGDTAGEFVAGVTLAQVESCATSPDWKSVVFAMRSAIKSAKDRGARPELSVVHLRFAEVLHKQGDLLTALEQLSEADKLFTETQMNWWSGQAAALRTRIEAGRPFVWFAPYVDGPPEVEV